MFSVLMKILVCSSDVSSADFLYISQRKAPLFFVNFAPSQKYSDTQSVKHSMMESLGFSISGIKATPGPVYSLNKSPMLLNSEIGTQIVHNCFQ